MSHRAQSPNRKANAIVVRIKPSLSAREVICESPPKRFFIAVSRFQVEGSKSDQFILSLRLFDVEAKYHSDP